MASILLWAGITMIVIGWLALAWQASKRMAVKNQMEKFPQVKQTMRLRRNYCWLTIAAGVILLLIAIVM